LCHPAQQPHAAAGNRSFFAKAIAPFATKLNFGDSLISLVFGTPREMTIEEISGPAGVIDQFVAAAKQCFELASKALNYIASTRLTFAL
jgi:2,4-dienoyl-CoA reductase-like NADH-dependent reductase (Old Yellow Enzyme family)